ncbi:MAG TPA: hypothetical protein VFM88_06625 [Vicinamibacteria bacterium]|nr:hypothetical protein [Vicinamibacteria bacterium]
MKTLLFASLAGLCGFALAAPPRWTPEKSDKEPGRARISVYRMAPGKQLDYLRWQAAQDEVAKGAGVAPPQVYVHVEGDDWDYLVIFPVTTQEQDKKMDEIARAKGLKTGFPASLEFRQLLSSHTDTLAAGPTTAAELVAAAGK